MVQLSYTDALASACDELVVEIATTPEQVLEAQQLRYRVYCEERGFLPGSNGVEEDEFDIHSRHVLVRSRTTGMVYGTVRVVLSDGGKESIGFPMERVCDDDILRPFPLLQTGEISRFAVTRDRTGLSPSTAALMRLCLIRGIVQVSGECTLTHWCATMERTLLRLLRATGICFQPVGAPIEYHGLRQPAIWALGSGFAQMRREQPQIWSFLTNDGAFWSEELFADQATEKQAA